MLGEIYKDIIFRIMWHVLFSNNSLILCLLIIQRLSNGVK